MSTIGQTPTPQSPEFVTTDVETAVNRVKGELVSSGKIHQFTVINPKDIDTRSTGARFLDSIRDFFHSITFGFVDASAFGKAEAKWEEAKGEIWKKVSVKWIPSADFAIDGKEKGIQVMTGERRLNKHERKKIKEMDRAIESLLREITDSNGTHLKKALDALKTFKTLPEGIFRLSPDKSLQEKLVRNPQADLTVKSGDEAILVAAVAKQIVRKEEPLKDVDIDALHKAVLTKELDAVRQLLPKNKVLEDICLYMNSILEQSQTTKMDLNNLALMLGPNLLAYEDPAQISKLKAIAMFLIEHPEVFRR